MSILDSEHFNKVIEIGKKAVEAFKEKNIIDFEKYSEKAWDTFPNPKSNWNQSYNIAKSFFKQNIELNKLDTAKIWLDRMIDNNNTLHNFDCEVEFYQGLYEFELNNFNTAYSYWKTVVKDAGYRYFENTKPEYLEFYRNPEKYTSND